MSQPLPAKSDRDQKDLTPLELNIISHLGNKLETKNPRWDLIDKMRTEHHHTFFFGECLFAASPRRSLRVRVCKCKLMKCKCKVMECKWFPACIEQAKFNHNKFSGFNIMQKQSLHYIHKM